MHYARLIEGAYALERMETHARVVAGVNVNEAVGIIEAPRGTLIHHHKVDENGAITWANLNGKSVPSISSTATS